MSKKRCQAILMCFILGMMNLLHGSLAKEFLKPEDAFLMSAVLTSQELKVIFSAQPGYYIYQESMLVQTVEQGNEKEIQATSRPSAHEKFDENFQKVVRTYTGEVTYTYALKDLPNVIPLYLAVQVQGCAEKGICYPPMTRYIQITQYDLKTSSVESIDAATSDNGASIDHWWNATDDLNTLNRLLQKTSIPVLLLIFFLLGIGLAFTPCMLPMLPILSSVVFGTSKHQALSRGRTSLLALAYILGMALAFSIAGMLTAAFGAGVSVYLQNPLVVIAFGILMMVLAGSLLGFYELQLPQTWQDQVQIWMGRQQGGNLFGVFMLGALSSLIASPCVTAPLAGVLTFIAQSGQVILGGLILFVMALGMGLPLMLFAIGAKRLVPKAGSWMVRVQRVLGVILIGFAVWMIYPALNGLLGTKAQQSVKQIGGLDYHVIRSQKELTVVLQKSIEQHQPMFMTYYADWCVSCKEIDNTILSDKSVQDQLKKYTLIEVDVTKTGEDQQALLMQFQLFGPPAFIFVGADGKERESLRVVGVISAEKLQEKLRLFSLQ
jgi:thiol:disulfide interchange protein DsbD